MSPGRSKSLLEIATKAARKGDTALGHRARTPAEIRKLLEPSEKQEQRLLFKWAELQLTRLPALSMLYAIPNAGGYTGGFKKNRGRVMSMKAEGVRSGVPDVCLPVARRGFHSLYIELKRQSGGTTSKEQEWWHRNLKAEGHYVAACRGWESARDMIEWYLR